MAEVKTKEEKRATLINDITETIESVIYWVFAVILINIFIISRARVDGSSMLPTLTHNDRLCYVHFLYEPKDGDIVIIDNDALEKPLVKRVIATAGQELNIDNETGLVYVDGKELDEQLYVEGEKLTARHFISSLTSIPLMSTYSADDFPVVIPEGFIFVMGDNREGSQDSRFSSVGLIPEEEILGKVLFKYYASDPQTAYTEDPDGHYTLKFVK